MNSDQKSSIVGELREASSAYLDLTPDRIVDRRLMEMVAQHVVPQIGGSSVLELGAGDAVWTTKLLDRFERVTTVDASEKLIERLAIQLQKHALVDRWSSAVSLFEDYTPDAPVQTVLASYVIDHLTDPGQLLVRARRQWLQPDGNLIVVVAHALSLHRRLAVCMGLASDVSELGPTNRRMAQRACFRFDEVERLIEDSGFRIVEKRGLMMKPLPNEMLVHCTDDQLRGLFQLGAELPIEYAASLYYHARPIME